MNDPSLEIRGLRAGYGARVVIEEVSLAIEGGKWFALMGPNGCGKSTLLDCVVGRLVPAQGEVRIAGFSLFEDPVDAKRHLGYGCTPESLLGILTARQCLEVHAGAKGISSVDAICCGSQMSYGSYRISSRLWMRFHLELVKSCRSCSACLAIRG